MKVRIIEPCAGLADERYDLPEFSFRPGEEVELHDDLAAAWIESGRAAPLESAEEAPAEEAPRPSHAHQHHDDPKAKRGRAR